MGDSGQLVGEVGGAVRHIVRQANKTHDQIRAELATLGTTAGEGFSLRPEQAHAALTKATELRDRLVDAQIRSSQLQKITPAAADAVSVSYNKRLTDGWNGAFSIGASGAAFDAGADQLQGAINYLNALRAKLKKALGIIDAADSDAKDAANAAGRITGGIS